ncbi:regulatory protein RecX [Bacillota bacterium Meth-B3]
MPVVTGLYESRGVVRVAVDGRAACDIGAKFFQKYPLAEGEAVDIEAYLGRVAAAQAEACYESALKLLSLSARTSAEIEKKLTQRGFVRPAICAALERLTEAHLIDDRALAERLVELKAEKPVGRYALKQKLRAKGVSDEDAQAALEQLTDEQQRSACRQMAEKLYPRYRDIGARAARAKLSQALARRGFSWDAIGAAVDALLSADDDEW